MKYLGTKFIGSDSSIFVLDTEKKSIFAISTERVTRKKHDPFDISPIFKVCKELQNEDYIVSVPFNNFKNVDFSLPTKFSTLFIFLLSSFQRRLNKINLKNNNKKVLNISDKPIIIRAVQNFSLCFQVLNKIFVNVTLRLLLRKSKINFLRLEYFDHHLSHVKSSYYLSDIDFKENTLALSIDGFGDGYWIKAYSVSNGEFKLIGKGKTNKIWNKTHFLCPSLGEIYGNFTVTLGFKRNSDEGKVEALAAYGEPDSELTKLLWKTFYIDGLDIKTDRVNILKFYDMQFLNGKANKIGRENFSASIQKFLQDFIVLYISEINKSFKFNNICLSGGVSANIIMNLAIYENFTLNKFYVVPAMGDDGSSAGAAILSALKDGHNLDWLRSADMPYYGEQFSSAETIKMLNKYKQNLTWEEKSNWEEDAATEINYDKVIAVFQGKAEFGPRALGNRSILANPTNPKSREILNAKIKNRPLFQPFCPTILAEERERLFKNSFDHKFMATAFRLDKKFYKLLPAITHIDGTARPQFIDKNDNESFWKILKHLKKINGFGVVINTSFNLHGRAMVRCPEDAILDFLACKIDILYINGLKVTRKSTNH